MADTVFTIVSLSDARDRSLQRYFTGTPCKRGHVAERYVSSKSCVECIKLGSISWKSNNKDKVSVTNKRCYAAKQELRRENRRIYSKQFPETQRIYRSKNPHKMALYKSTRRVRKLGNGGSHTAADILEIFKMQRGRCACCRKNLGKKYSVDHIVAIANGGTNDRRNIQILCGPCNSSKSAKDPIRFMQERGMML